MRRFCLSVITGLTVLALFYLPVPAQAFLKEIRFEINADYNIVSIEGVDEYLNDVNAFRTSEHYDKIDDIRGLSVGVRQTIYSKIGVMAEFGYLTGSTNQEEVTVWNKYGVALGTVQEEFRFSTIHVSVGPSYRYEREAKAIQADIKSELHFMKFRHHTSENKAANISGYDSDWNGMAFGLNGVVAAEWLPRSKVAVGGRVGYRVTESTDLTNDNNLIKTIIADLKGFYVSIYLAIMPWS